MNKISIIAVCSFLAGGLLLPNSFVFAQNTNDMDVSTPVLLPTSPFYFLKEASRGITSFFTFNPVKKAELEVRFADEKLIEAKTVMAKNPQNEKVIENAFDGYNRQLNELKTRLSGLEVPSQNPDVDALLNKVTDRAIKHRIILDEATMTSAKDEGSSFFSIEPLELMGAVSQKDGTQFSGRLTRVVEEQKVTGFKALKSLEMMDRAVGVLPQAVQGGVQDVIWSYRDGLLGKAVKEISDINEAISAGPQVPPEVFFSTLPSESSRQIKIIDDIKQRVMSEKTKPVGNISVPSIRIGQTLDSIREGLVPKMQIPVPATPLPPKPLPLPFPIENPITVKYPITVIWPVAGDRWQAGETYTIAWKPLATVETVNIYLDTGIKCVTKPCPSRITIAENVPAVDNIFYYWTIPLNMSAYPRAQIIIADSSNGDVGGRSGYFSITGVTGIRVILPVSGDQYQTGLEYGIAWAAQPSVSAVNIYFEDVINGGATNRTTIAENIPVGIMYFWTIPLSFGSHPRAQIVVTDSSNSGISGRSGYFSIVGTPN